MKLNLRVEYVDGESQASFASRLSARNGRHGLYPFTKDFEIDIDALLSGRDGPLDWLADAGGVSLDRLTKYAIRHDGMDKVIGCERINMNKLVTNFAKLCPKCAAEDLQGKDRSQFPYSLPDTIDQRVPWIETCLIHEVSFVDLEIPDYAKKYTRFPAERAMIVEANEAAIYTAIASPIPMKATEYERYVSARLRGTVPGNELLAELSISAIMDAAAELGKAVIESSVAENMDEPTSREVRDIGFCLMTDTYDEFKRKMLDVWPDETSQFSVKRFGKFGVWLQRKMTSTLFDPLKVIVARIVNETSAAGPGDEVFGVPIESRHWHSTQSVADASAVANRTVWRIYKNRGWTMEENPTKPKSEYLISVDEGDALIAELTDFQTELDVARQIGARSDVGRSIVDAGVLTHIAGTGMSGVDAMIAKHEVDNFVETLQSKLRLVAHSSMMPIHTAVRRTRARTADLIAAIVDGRLDAEITSWELRLENIHLDVEEIRVAQQDPNFVRSSDSARRVKWKRLPAHGKD